MLEFLECLSVTNGFTGKRRLKKSLGAIQSTLPLNTSSTRPRISMSVARLMPLIGYCTTTMSRFDVSRTSF